MCFQKRTLEMVQKNVNEFYIQKWFSDFFNPIFSSIEQEKRD